MSDLCVTPQTITTNRRVWSHYMAGLGVEAQNQTVSQYMNDVNDAISAGVDGFQINIPTFDPSSYHTQNCENLIKAITRIDSGFEFFPSFDVGLRELKEDHVFRWYGLYYDHPNHARINGLPIMSAWQIRSMLVPSGFESQSDYLLYLRNKLAQSGMPVCFVPWSSTTGDEWDYLLDDLFPGLDGFWSFRAGKDSTETLTFNTNAAEACRTRNMVYFGGLSPMFHAFLLGKNPGFTDGRGGEELSTKFEGYISNSPELTYLLIHTWNDFGENHHFTPRNAHGNGYAAASNNHSGFTELLKYHLARWKYIEPLVYQDTVIVFHMTQLKDGGTSPYPMNEWPAVPEDLVYISTILKEPATLEVTSGGLAAQVFSAPAGLSHHRANAAVGAQSFSLVRDSTEILSGTTSREIDSVPSPWTWDLHSDVFKT